MTLRGLLLGGAALAGIAGGTAHAATIVLIDQGGVAGSAAEQGFNIAAAYWSATLSNSITIRLGVSYAALDAGVIGQTGSSGMDYSVSRWEANVRDTKSNSSTDTNIVLPTLTNNAVAFITNATNAGGRGIDSTRLRYDDSTSGMSAINNNTLYLNTANVKAIGGIATYDDDPTSLGYNPQQLDGEVQFSSNFGFDFNPTDGIDANTFDFIGVAIHEIGHALGFVSGVDYIDYFATPRGPGSTRGNAFDFNRTSIYSALDMFRYSTDPTNLVPGTAPVLDLAIGGEKYFSIDGGVTALYGNGFSNGAFNGTLDDNGNGDQASHWTDASGANACGPQLGIMDPTFCYQQRGEVTALDLAAFDAIGYNLADDARGAGYLQNTAQIYQRFAATAQVPEPASWTLMILGFGAVGAALRRRSVRVSFAA